jgi:hypothetical protein
MACQQVCDFTTSTKNSLPAPPAPVFFALHLHLSKSSHHTMFPWLCRCIMPSQHIFQENLLMRRIFNPCCSSAEESIG